MNARLFTNAMQGGHAARDYIRLVQQHLSSPRLLVTPKSRRAHAVLESLEDQSRSIPDDPVVPIKPLVRILTESLRGTPSMAADDEGRTEGANLYRGCRVRLRGIPERQFVIHEIFWDYEEVRIREIGQERLFYLVPWDCLEIIRERTE